MIQNNQLEIIIEHTKHLTTEKHVYQTSFSNDGIRNRVQILSFTEYEMRDIEKRPMNGESLKVIIYLLERVLKLNLIPQLV